MAKILASFDTENGALIVMVDGSAVEADCVCLDTKGPYAHLSHSVESGGVKRKLEVEFGNKPEDDMEEDDMDESMSTQAVADVKNYFGVR